MPSALTMKLIGGLAGLLILGGLVLGLKHYKSLAERRGQSLATICQATRDASGQRKLPCGDVPEQVKFMGEAVKTLSGSLARQSAAVAAMGEQTKAQQAATAEASRNAAERAGRAEATASRLTASSRAGEAQAKPCAPSKALQEQWR
jgi:O-acetyl-ADP-ribose deacetylase (regulator of RNase III)